MQRKVVDQILENKDTVTIMPTGAGKSVLLDSGPSNHGSYSRYHTIGGITQ
jgi:hypothetical protein